MPRCFVKIQGGLGYPLRYTLRAALGTDSIPLMTGRTISIRSVWISVRKE